jgi:transketolase
MGDIAAKFESFGWNAQDIDGNNVKEISEAIQNAKNTKGKPSVIVLNTIKGKGCSFVEGKENNHHVTISKEQMEQALAELNEQLEKVVAK